MAAPGTAPIPESLGLFSPEIATEDLLTAILRAHPRVSDLIFSPGRNLQVHVNGEFISLGAAGAPFLTTDDTRRVASDLIGSNKAAINLLREHGCCDISYALPRIARFRVNVFIQRGSCAVVMRVIPTVVPTFKTLGLPDQLREIAKLHDGLVLITGPRGAGKSSTLAALLDYINETEARHIITIEDPIEFLHNHKRSTVHQRELHSDTPTIAEAMKAALRQVPNIIAVGELKDPQTIELALESAETGHLVLSTLNTLSAQQTLERVAGAFQKSEQQQVRNRLARILRYVVSQRLVPRKDAKGRSCVFDVFQAGSESFGRLLIDQDHAPGELDGPTIDSQIEDLVRAGIVSREIALAHALDARALAQRLGIE
ncbi:MAG TPA: ATPase, T2SS/T4P/T4SS family [Terriglobales bacterium]|nr:ATPase, T2SS/T4P/T4SS family [Terriglobales bacterium]